jgi:hypothetical protein
LVSAIQPSAPSPIRASAALRSLSGCGPQIDAVGDQKVESRVPSNT